MRCSHAAVLGPRPVSRSPSRVRGPLACARVLTRVLSSSGSFTSAMGIGGGRPDVLGAASIAIGVGASAPGAGAGAAAAAAAAWRSPSEGARRTRLPLPTPCVACLVGGRVQRVLCVCCSATSAWAAAYVRSAAQPAGLQGSLASPKRVPCGGRASHGNHHHAEPHASRALERTLPLPADASGGGVAPSGPDAVPFSGSAVFSDRLLAVMVAAAVCAWRQRA